MTFETQIVGRARPQVQWGMGAWTGLCAAIVAAAGIGGMRLAVAQDQDATTEQHAVGPTNVDGDDWAPVSDGIACRLVAISPETDDEEPDLSAVAASFAGGEAVTFGVELSNVGDKPVTLLGVRYGDAYPTAAGKLNTAHMGPRLFEFEFTDVNGAPIPRAVRNYIDSLQMDASSTSAHDLQPGASLIVVLRPAKFSSPMDLRLPAGEYRARVRYRGPTKAVRDQVAQTWPDKPQGRAWTGEVTSNDVAFAVTPDPRPPSEPVLVWGEAVSGLRAAVELRPRDAAADDPPNVAPLNSQVDATLHIENVGDKPISLTSETWRQDDSVTATDRSGAGQNQDLGGTFYSGWPLMVRWTLKPGEQAEIRAAGLAVVANAEATKEMEHPVGRALVARPGQYTIRYEIRLGGIQMKDAQGKVTVPGPNDWTGTLTTGETPLLVRGRTKADEARVQARLFTGLVEFVSADGTPVTSGSFTVRKPSQQKEPASLAVHEGVIEVPECSAGGLTISVRAAGFEEASFNDVTLTPGRAKRLELVCAEPARFRVVLASDGTPVSGAQVRYFLKNSEGASSGPYPTDSVKGPVWAVSDDDGRVVLDTLQKVNPLYRDLGDAVYFFYVEAPELAATFVGPVKAGQELPDVRLGRPINVQGEVHGTAEELERFDAEWDQPYEVTAGFNPAFAYAESQRLETKRDGDKLTFQLTGLRPGKLRFISNFGPRPHSVQHTYSRREPQGSDVVAEIELKGDVGDIVLTPKGRE